jgi:hypothetical protein
VSIRLATVSTLVGAVAMAGTVMALPAAAAVPGTVTITAKSGVTQTWLGATTTCYEVTGPLATSGDTIANNTSHAIYLYTTTACTGNTYINLGAGDTITNLGIIKSFATNGP